MHNYSCFLCQCGLFIYEKPVNENAMNEWNEIYSKFYCFFVILLQEHLYVYIL